MLEDQLQDWKNTYGMDSSESQRDRLIVYATSKREQFTRVELFHALQDTGEELSLEQIEDSLIRLQLAFILQWEQEVYRYCVPLLQEIIRSHSLSGV